MGIDFGECLSFGWERFKNNPAFYIVGFLIIAIVSFAMSMVSQVVQSVLVVVFAVGAEGAHASDDAKGLIMFIPMIVSFFVSTILGALVAPVFVGFFKGVKREYEGGQAEVGDVFTGLQAFLPSIIAYLLSSFIVLLGLLCCLIPGIILAPMINLSMCHMADEDIGGVEAVKRAFGTIKKEPIVILWSIVLGIIGFLGVFACGVGLLVTLPLSLAAFYAVYRQSERVGGIGGGEDVIDAVAESV